MTEAAQEALACLSRGWSVIPLHSIGPDGRCTCSDPEVCAAKKSQGKHPRIAWEEFTTRRATEAEVLAWGKRWPGCNWGIVTGAVSGLLVLDVDGEEGRETLRRQKLHTPPTTIAETGGGGWHYLYRHPGGEHPNTAGTIGPKVDTRGDGGYIVAAGGRHVSGGRYAWLVAPEDSPPADPPSWLLERTQATKAAAPPLPERIPPGKRNELMTSLAGSMRRRGGSQAGILAALRVENRERCEPPLSGEELQQIAASVGRYAPAPNGDGHQEEPEAPAEAYTSGHPAAEQPAALDIVSAVVLSAMTPERPAWIVRGILARGASTYLAGKIKAGKTSLVLALVEAVLSGRPFLGLETEEAGVLYLTEQNRPSFRAGLERARLLDDPRLHIGFRGRGRSHTWGDVLEEAAAFAQQEGLGLLVVDTVNAWSRVQDENDAAQALAAMAPVEEVAGKGLAVLLVAHGRKGGGDIGDDARGSSAFGGSADVLLSLRRMNQPGHETRRELECVSRFDGAPDRLVIERQGYEYVCIGNPEELERQQAREAVIALLPQEAEAALDFATIRERTECKQTTLVRAVAELVEAGQVLRDKGAGQASNRAFGYWGAPQEVCGAVTL